MGPGPRRDNEPVGLSPNVQARSSGRQASGTNTHGARLGRLFCLQSFDELLKRVRQSFGLINRHSWKWIGLPLRQWLRSESIKRARCRRVQRNHPRPAWRLEIDRFAPPPPLCVMQHRAGNGKHRKNDHEECESVINLGRAPCGNCRT